MESLSPIEIAVKEQMLFKSELKGGTLDIFDLFQLPVSTKKSNALSLKALGRELTKELKDCEDEDFAEESSGTVDSMLKVKIAVIKRIIAIKDDEAEQAKKAIDKKHQREYLLGLRSRLEEKEILEGGKTVADVDAMLAELDKD